MGGGAIPLQHLLASNSQERIAGDFHAFDVLSVKGTEAQEYGNLNHHHKHGFGGCGVFWWFSDGVVGVVGGMGTFLSGNEISFLETVLVWFEGSIPFNSFCLSPVGTLETAGLTNLYSKRFKGC